MLTTNTTVERRTKKKEMTATILDLRLRLGYSNRYHHHCLVLPIKVLGKIYISSSTLFEAFFSWSLRP